MMEYTNVGWIHRFIKSNKKNLRLIILMMDYTNGGWIKRVIVTLPPFTRAWTNLFTLTFRESPFLYFWITQSRFSKIVNR